MWVNKIMMYKMYFNLVLPESKIYIELYHSRNKRWKLKPKQELDIEYILDK